MSRIGWPVALLLIAASHAPGAAWSSQGHVATGALAYDRLTASDPAAIAQIDAILSRHPDRSRFDAALAGLEGAARDRRLFELIARWPDEIRGTAYNHTHWHHQLRVVSGWTTFRGVRLGSADHAFAASLRLAGDARADPAKRAVALCWLFHVTGDMHQPLHAGHRQDGRFPLTDRAGTLGWVKAAPDAKPETLHHFWDTAADRQTGDFEGGEEIARLDEARQISEPPSGEDAGARYRSWVRESEQFAATVAYQGPGLTESPKRARAPVLSPDYVDGARRLAEQRLGQAGDRLASLLAELFPAN